MPIVWLVLPLMLAFACYGEIKSRRIPNWLTLGGIALGLGAAAIENGLEGLTDSALGLAIAGGLFLPFCLLGVGGGGRSRAGRWCCGCCATRASRAG